MINTSTLSPPIIPKKPHWILYKASGKEAGEINTVSLS